MRKSISILRPSISRKASIIKKVETHEHDQKNCDEEFLEQQWVTIAKNYTYRSQVQYDIVRLQDMSKIMDSYKCKLFSG